MIASGRFGAALWSLFGVRTDRSVGALTYQKLAAGEPRLFDVPCTVVGAANAYRGVRGRLIVPSFWVRFAGSKELFSRHWQNLRLPDGSPLMFAGRTSDRGLWWVSGPSDSPALERPLTVYESAFLSCWADWGDGFDPTPREGWRCVDGAEAVATRRAAPYPLAVSQLEREAEVAREAGRVKRHAARVAALRAKVKAWSRKSKVAEGKLAHYTRALTQAEKKGSGS